MTQILTDSSHDASLGRQPWGAYNFLSRGPGFHMDAHQHAYLQLIHVLAGELRVELAGKSMRLGPGDVHLLPPGYAHALFSPQGYRQFGVNFTADPDNRGLLNALLQAFPEPACVLLPFRETWEEALDREVLEGLHPDWFRVFHTLDDYAISLLETQTERAAETRVRELVGFLSAHLQDPLQVADIAQALSVSRATLQRLCQRTFQCGAAHLHERLRLQRAATRLLDPELSVGECAVACGYADVFHFSRAFKRVFGVSPTAYRAEPKRAWG